MEKTNHEFEIRVGSIIIPLIGLHSIINEADERLKDYDFSVLEFTDRDVIELLQKEQLFYNMGTIKGINASENIILYGYLLKYKVTRFGNIVQEFQYGHFISTFDDNFIFVEYHRRKLRLGISKLKSFGPIPIGCSGAGAWQIDNGHLNLVGIFLEYERNSAKLKFTRIERILHFINLVYFLKNRYNRGIL